VESTREQGEEERVAGDASLVQEKAAFKAEARRMSAEAVAALAMKYLQSEDGAVVAQVTDAVAAIALVDVDVQQDKAEVVQDKADVTPVQTETTPV
jgi:hypothetical protein